MGLLSMISVMSGQTTDKKQSRTGLYIAIGIGAFILFAILSTASRGESNGYESETESESGDNSWRLETESQISHDQTFRSLNDTMRSYNSSQPSY